jgi:hypothetical protein
MFTLLLFHPGAPENDRILELVGHHMDWGKPIEVENDQSVRFHMPAEDVQSGQRRVEEALDAAGKKLDLDWTKYFRFANVPGH